jgi:predicted aldo/keto reductase-like oxidoreductase
MAEAEVCPRLSRPGEIESVLGESLKQRQSDLRVYFVFAHLSQWGFPEIAEMKRCLDFVAKEKSERRHVIVGHVFVLVIADDHDNVGVEDIKLLTESVYRPVASLPLRLLRRRLEF